MTDVELLAGRQQRLASLQVHGILHMDFNRGLAGFEPIPHIPVRLMANAETLDRTLDRLVRDAHVQEVLLIAGDYATPVGPYSAVGEVLGSGALAKHGLTKVSIAGHPEGHPVVALDEIRRAEREKLSLIHI